MEVSFHFDRFCARFLKGKLYCLAVIGEHTVTAIVWPVDASNRNVKCTSLASAVC